MISHMSAEDVCVETPIISSNLEARNTIGVASSKGHEVVTFGVEVAVLNPIDFRFLKPHIFLPFEHLVILTLQVLFQCLETLRWSLNPLNSIDMCQ